jgi:hypothetical protein
VRSRIRGLIGGEPASETLSDDRIVELLRGEGIDIARRTVAKYREAMRIPSAETLDRVGRAQGYYNLIWEDQPRIDGFEGRTDFYTELEAQEAQTQAQTWRGYRRSSVEYAERTGMWVLRVECSKAARPKTTHVWQARIVP